MPRGRRVYVQSSSEGEDDDDVAPSQLTQSQRSKKARSNTTLEEENIDAFVSNTVKLILQFSITKIPFKRSDLVKVGMNNEPRLIAKVMDKVKNALGNIYGMELHEVKDTKSNKQYMCISKIPHTTSEELTPEEKAEMMLLYLILEYIFMKGGEVTDTALWQYLSRFEIQEREEHDYFGEPYHLIYNVFHKQLYLQSEKTVSEGSHIEKIMIRWGQRAQLEFDKKEILDFACSKLGVHPMQYLQQYQEAYGTLSAEDLDDELSNITEQGLGLSSQPHRSKTHRNKPSTSQKASEAMDVDDVTSNEE